MDGSNDTLTKEEYEALVSEKDASSTDHNSLAIHKGSQGATGAGEQIQGPLSEDAELYVAEAGRHSKKRKIGKVIKDADEIDPTSEVTKTVAPTTKKITSKTKKAKKAIKLSFDVD
ncbi:hypothetical protein EJ05DRAFT_475356 [Pseudovirgaria hyperparasitica]|uniref:DUF4604 domain-containing protein n=1 Tax=Pseudovirgaria hyperparasitica TaxID=470096 RepID=A0A6A6W8B7_9PEZI|nr:uncharacterized protein EJ05DRAFT_475356 [Pseudovirgaria hyperparasitica]KAF2759128.1 hypothetical protein EJ05DRAFT_475356 [Pseudovirgaria hyperparasitica]